MNSRRLIGAPEGQIETILSTKTGGLEAAADVRFGSKADIAFRQRHVCFTPKSGHRLRLSPCPLCAKSRHYDCHAPIISSALTMSACGKVRPSAFAVLRLRTSLNLVGCSTGRSAGFAPFSILSV
jgi:hypothetical protein